VVAQAPTRSEIRGDLASVILPAVSTYQERGRPIAEEVQIAILLRNMQGVRKMTGWPWTGGTPYPAI
jgi:hypothetical protein